MSTCKIDLTGEQIQQLKPLFDKGHRYAQENKDPSRQFVILAQVFDSWDVFGNNDKMTFGVLLGKEEGLKGITDLLNKHGITRLMPDNLNIRDEKGFIKFNCIQLRKLTHPVPFAALCQIEIKNMGIIGYIHCEVNEYCFISVGNKNSHRFIKPAELREITLALNYLNEGNGGLLNILPLEKD